VYASVLAHGVSVRQLGFRHWNRDQFTPEPQFARQIELIPGESMSIRYRVIKVKDSEPEKFIVIGIDFGEHMVKSTSGAMEEPELREHLHQAGATEDQIKAWIQQGRAYPG
jgi:hypothetical protein